MKNHQEPLATNKSSIWPDACFSFWLLFIRTLTFNHCVLYIYLNLNKRIYFISEWPVLQIDGSVRLYWHTARTVTLGYRKHRRSLFFVVWTRRESFSFDYSLYQLLVARLYSKWLATIAKCSGSGRSSIIRAIKVNVWVEFCCFYFCF